MLSVYRVLYRKIIMLWCRDPFSTLPNAGAALLIVVVVQLWIITTIEGIQEYPSVKILKWKTPESQDWEYENLTSDLIAIKEQGEVTTYTIERRLDALSIVCNASYPVKWVLEHYNRTFLSFFRVTTYRDIGDFEDETTYRYSAVLDIYIDLSKITGGYSCQSAREADEGEEIRNRIYIYSPGMSPPYLVNAGQALSASSADNKTLILPCFVTSPEVVVALYKKIGKEYLAQRPGPYMLFDPKVGFMLNMAKISDPYGDYKCSVAGKDEGSDFVYVHAAPGESNLVVEENRNIIRRNASFGYDPERHEFKCCASGPKAPNLRISYCENVNICEARKYDLFQAGNEGIKSKNSSCTTKLLEAADDAGVIRCKGDGVDVFHEFFPPLVKAADESEETLYFDWEDADYKRVIAIYQHDAPMSGKMYANETVYMTCETSDFMFSRGTQWAIKWKNGTSQHLKPHHSANLRMNRGMDIMRTITFVADLNMREIACAAPLWESSNWGYNYFDLTIEPSLPPSISGPTTESVRWTLNDTNKSISCAAENGIPTPTIRWRKNNRVFLSDAHVSIRRGIGTSVITFKKVSHDTEGEYTCLAGNPVGRTTKTIRIFIDLPTKVISSSWILGAVLTFLVLISGIAFLVWKLKLQKSVIDHLTRVVFRDKAPSPGNA